MKIRTLLFVVIITSFLPLNTHAIETIRITNGEWPPYMSKELKHYGFFSHIITEAFALQGVKVEWGFFPWKRSYIYAESGEWDATAGWSHFPHREKHFHFSDTIVDSKWVFFHLKSYPFDWSTYRDLREIKVGGTMQYAYKGALQKAEEEGVIEIERVPQDEQNLKKLLSGRIDIFPQEVEVGYEMINNEFTPEEAMLFTHHPLPAVASDELRLLFSKKVERNRHLVDVFNQGLKQLRESGRIEQMIAASRKGEYKN
ncbi:MAG: transporter substrate-binding domain-containing protein [Thermodesulfobacteriota bacterium]